MALVVVGVVAGGLGLVAAIKYRRYVLAIPAIIRVMWRTWRKPAPVQPAEPVLSLRVMVLGLDSAGKSSILKALSGESIEGVAPTSGFVQKEMPFAGAQCTFVDIGGDSKIRPYWPRYLKFGDSLIYVIDGSDTSRIEEAQNLLHVMLESAVLQGAPLLVLINKSDVSTSADAKTLLLRDQTVKKDRVCLVLTCSAKDADSVRAAVTTHISEHKKYMKALLS
nr:Arl3b [Gefionella okellyi]|eukprot:TRINITY_DN3933_c0_g2_i2.p1 TRINITY_DN3933_c0_g2~~TRINITY_DN3933_c0_g2_i2.p1  ORF type:complete len:222 (+),score=52.27 TRINITY_DN3933_c0_g2_i2:5-670(+)